MRTLLSALIAFSVTAMAAAQPAGDQGNDFNGRPPGGFRGGEGDEGRRGGPRPNAMFQVIDADGDGVITRTELRKAAAALKQLDTDNDGNITLAEVSPASPWGDPAQFIDRILDENDKNGDGQLTADELPDRMKQMLEGADTNGDGAITRDELTASMENMRNRFRGAGRGRDRFRGGPEGVGPNGAGADPRTGQFLQHDVNNDGRLTYDEIPRAMRSAFRPEDDRNGDGAVDAAELQAVIARMGGASRAPGAGAGPGGDPNTFRDPNRRNRQRPGDQN